MPTTPTASIDPNRLVEETFAFIRRCEQENGAYAPSPDPAYKGRSDSGMSDLACVTYAAVLAKTMGWKLPHPERSIDFIQRHQTPDGSFVSWTGQWDEKSDISRLYNTVQGVVGLRALGAKPKIDPSRALDRLFEGEAFAKLPAYTTSFFPLFYAALDKPFPAAQDQALRDLQTRKQAADGYLGDHVAATFHTAHYYRVIGLPTPRAREMVQRVLRDQTPQGGWNIKEPDWDVHACYDAVFILRQLGGDAPAVRRAIDKAADWTMACRNPDGGFGLYAGWPSDLGALYFQFGTLIIAGRVPGAKLDLPDAHTLSWGHAMAPDRIYGK